MTTATLKRVATTVANMSADEQALFIADLQSKCATTTPKAREPKAVAKQAVKQARDWRTAKPSKAQKNRNRAILRAINASEDVLGYRHSTIDSLGVKGPTAGDYSDAYGVMKRLHDSLRAERRNLGL